MDIYLKKAALHIVDRESGDPIYSQSELDLTKEYVREYLIKKIQKLSSAQTKTGTLAEDSTFALLSQQAVGMKLIKKVRKHQVRMPLSCYTKKTLNYIWPF